MALTAAAAPVSVVIAGTPCIMATLRTVRSSKNDSRPSGGGKRDLHSYEYYNRDSGIAVYTAPSIKPGKFFLYFDPLHSLSEEYQQRWQIESEQQRMVEQATDEAKRNLGMC
jgi:hypothetical protein